VRLIRGDLIHLLPVLIYLAGIIFFYFASGQHILLSKKIASHPVYTVYGFTVTAVYIIMIVRYLVSTQLKSRQSGKAIPKVEERETAVFRAPIPAITDVHIGSVVLTGSQVEKIHLAVKDSLETKKSFLQKGYNLRQLSEDTSIPLHHLSAFINQFYNTHFNHLINEHRVRYCEDKIQNGEWRSKTLEAIAEESGFNNRNTFTSSFKKVTGFNPSAFLQSVKQHQIA